MMSIPRIFVWCISGLLTCQVGLAQTASPPPYRAKQLRVGVDVFQPALYAGQSDRSVYEGFVDYYWKNELYAVLEAGYGKANYPYDNLDYTTANPFIKIGFDKSLLPRLVPSDWDMISIGLRYGIGWIQRSEVRYSVGNSIWGMQSGTLPADNMLAHWGEITGGMRLNLIGRLGAGWNVRGKFILNAGRFAELPPALIAGYGKGDKGTSFGFNIYLLYALSRQ